MATTRIATLEFSANKNCFVALPVAWMRDFSKKQNVIFEVQWGDNGKAYISWAGEYIRQAGLTSPDPDAAIQINGLFANKLGLRHGQEVLLSPVTGILPCSRVFVEPASIDDWEILELNANYIESNLLNQVRVVWKNQILPIWIDKKICLFIKIGASEPHAPCIKLEPSTELVVAPKARLQSSTSSQRLVDSHLATTIPTKTEHNLYSDSIQALTDSRLSSASSKESGFSLGSTLSGFGGDQEASTTMTDKSFISSSRESGFETTATTPAFAPLDLEAISLGGAIPWSYRVWSTIKWLLFRYGDTQFGKLPNTDNEEDARRKMAAEFWKDIRIIARVQPMLDKQKHDNVIRGVSSSGSVTSVNTQTPTPNRPSSLPISTLRSKRSRQSSPASNLSSSSSTNSYTHLMQPTTVYLSSSSDTYFQNMSSDSSSKESRPSSNDFVVFLAHLTKLLSPRERKEELNKKLAEAQRKTQEGSMVNGNQPPKLVKNNQGADAKTKNVNQHSAPLTSCVVRCIIHTKELKGHRAKQPNNIYSSTTFDDTSIRWFLQVPELLRRQLGLECTSKVQLRPVIEPPQPIHSLMLHPLFEMPEIGKEAAVKAFSHWLSCVSCMISPIPICRYGTLVKFPISKTGESMGEFLISVNGKMTEPGEDMYYLLHPLVARKVIVTIGEMITETNKPAEIAKLPYWSSADLDGTVEGYKLRELGGVGDLGKQAIQHIHTALMARPLSNQMCQSLPGVQQGGLLICGPSGCGKSTLARAICRQVSDWPSLAYATVVECKPLKGKRVDVIRKALEEAFNEASWRQPSIILLDDLDQVTRAPLGPEEEIGPEAVFNAHVAQVVREVLTTEINEHSKVCIIATARSKSSLHQTLTSSRGSHFFQSILEIQPLDKVQRIEVFISVIQSKVDVQMQTIDILDLDHLASRTEGFVARDIVTVVERAIHAGCSREIAQGKRPPPVPIQKDPEHPYDEILLTNEDFDVALNQYTPSSLRDVPLHSAGKLGWEDIGGLRDVKQALIETLQLPAKFPGLFASCPLRLRSGLLLYGPPGTGKTLLGGIVAKECGLNFISIKGPELLSKYIGASEQGVRDLFGRAQSAKPCILFFDEFDSLAPRRGHDSTGVTDRVVNQLLTQLDGVEGLEGVYVIGATSRPDLIDPALLRPGRLDKCLFCPIPTAEERVDIIQALSRNLPLSPAVDLSAVALQCDYFTGADLKALLYNAQLEAIHSIHVKAKTSSEADYESLGALDPSRCRSMDANDWKLTFLESFASESEVNQLLSDNAMAQLQGMGEGSGTTTPNATDTSVFSNKDLDLESGNASDSSLGSVDSLRLNLQDLNFSTGQGTQAMATGQGSHVTTPGSYVMTPEERRRSIEMVLKASYGPKGPSLKDLAEWKMLYEHGRRSPRPLLSGDSIENEEVPGPLEEPGASRNQPLIYMPTLRDGVVDPSKETQERLNSQITVVKENYISQVRDTQANISGARQKGLASAITITQAHLLKALSTMKPSVSATERARYQRLYDSFVQSRGGDFTPVQQTDEKRATLA